MITTKQLHIPTKTRHFVKIHLQQLVVQNHSRKSWHRLSSQTCEAVHNLLLKAQVLQLSHSNSTLDARPTSKITTSCKLTCISHFRQVPFQTLIKCQNLRENAVIMRF